MEGITTFALLTALLFTRIQSNVPVGWGTWGEWGSCSSTCGVGIQNRNRSCVEPLSSSDDDFCNGETTDYQLCMPRACTDGGWASWGSWSSCTATCGGGTSKRYRECTNPTPSPYGQQCYGPNVDFDVCSIFPCESQGAVAFYAVLANKALNLRKGQTVVFDRVLTNIASTQSGGSYNATTGVFTAPLSGVYVFSCSIMAYDTSFTHVALHKNNIPLSTMYVNGRSGHNFDSAASTVTVSLTKGDRVYAKHIDNDQGLEGIYYAGQSTFTGFLVQRQHDDAPVVGLK
ncbi:ectin-like isoform X2 [Dreissena polymorpha]|uniref:ectin-like isoform X2 n=1 Tax=Dreissena polymorpha TaxID=45954 RepID=UPI0022647B8F|nr:ectin-like isoform X2 [Dreissena polymorpha]